MSRSVRIKTAKKHPVGIDGITAMLSLAITGLCGVEQALVSPQARPHADLVSGGPWCSQFESRSLRKGEEPS